MDLPKKFWNYFIFIFFREKSEKKKKIKYGLRKRFIYIIGLFVLFGCECTKYSDIDCVGNLELAFQMGIFYSIKHKMTKAALNIFT